MKHTVKIMAGRDGRVMYVNNEAEYARFGGAKHVRRVGCITFAHELQKWLVTFAPETGLEQVTADTRLDAERLEKEILEKNFEKIRKMDTRRANVPDPK